MRDASLIETLLRRQRGIAIAGLALISIAAWAFVLSGSGTGMSIGAMSTWRFPPPMDSPLMDGAWTAAWWLIVLAMWWVMMVAMMLPSAAPMILLVGQVSRRAEASGKTALSTGWLAMGYRLAWLAFSAVATGLQFALEQAGLVHGMLMWSLRSLALGDIARRRRPLSIDAAQVCLPDAMPITGRLPGRTSTVNGIMGALELGVSHGLWCVGCCAALMALLFVGGIMNLVWIAGLALIVLVEKLLPDPRPFSVGVGVLFAWLPRVTSSRSARCWSVRSLSPGRA